MQRSFFTQTTHKTRLSDVDGLLFPVETFPVSVDIKSPEGAVRLPVPERKAIVDTRSQRVVGVVGRDYRLVTNEQALQWARECCRALFSKTAETEWQVQAADGPSTGSYCHIDLVHNSAALNFDLVRPRQRPDVFGPFVRVTNSYNGLRALSFDIGFHRKVCSNGLILPDSVIRFHFSHSRVAIGPGVEFKIAHDRLTALTARFTESLDHLHQCEVSPPLFAPIVRGVLALGGPNPVKKTRSADAEEWGALTAAIEAVGKRYVSELGATAYAVLNTVTDLASRPPDNRYLRRDRHALQRLAGTWLNSFSVECRKPGFNAAAYASQLAIDGRSFKETE